MSSEKCMRHKGVLHKKGYPLHDEFMKDGRLFILGDSWGRKRWDGGPQTKKPTKTTNNLPSNSDFIHQGEDFDFKLHQFSSVQFSCSVVSDSLWHHESQHARPLCPSPTPAVHSDSRPSSPWCHPAISSSVVSSSCPQSLPASESFPMSQLFHEVAKVLELQL